MLPPIPYYIWGSKIEPVLSIHQMSLLEEPLRQSYAKQSE